MKKFLPIVAGVITTIIILPVPCLGQDSHLSQYYASELTLNPALTGMFNGDYRVHLHYRAQWKPIINTPYETTILAYDQPYKRFGIGAYIMNNRAGSGGVNFFNAIVSAAYEITIDPLKVHHLTTGLQLGIINKSFIPGLLTFNNQYDTSYSGGTFNPNLLSGESYDKTNILLPEVNFGVFYFNEKRNALFNPYAGVSGFHLTQPKESFYSVENQLPLRVVGYAGTRIKINDIYSAEPNLLFMKQANDNEIQFGILGYYHIEGSDANFFVGPYYRNKDAVILQLGGTYKEYTIRISYDINTSSLNEISHGRGGFEVSITYSKQSAKYLPSIL